MLTVVLAGILTLGGIEVAHAYMTATVRGTGTALNGTSAPASLSPATITTGQRPGGAATLTLTASNTNPSPLRSVHSPSTPPEALLS